MDFQPALEKQRSIGGICRDHRLVLLIAVFASIWILLFRCLAVHWSATEQYRYGWVVPVLAAYAFLIRWKSRPVPAEPSHLAMLVVAGAALCFFPTWVIFQPNPDWRLLNWLLTAEIAAITLGVIAVIGGRTWSRHFAFPCLFVFTAVPWPRPLEIPLTEHLTRTVTWITVELLNLSGIIAFQDANVIEIGTGRLGVEDACSGIQSLQASLTAALFFGEFFRATKKNRVYIALVSVLAALVTNILRTYFLAFSASHDGLAAVAKWHDVAANLALIGCLVAVLTMSSLLGRAVVRTSSLLTTPRCPSSLLWGLSLWFVATIAITELWYHNGEEPMAAPWSLYPPPTSSTVTLPKLVSDELRADESVTAKWHDEGGRGYFLYFFRWKPGPPRARLLARLHQPDRCLPSTGFKLIRDRGKIVAGPPDLPLEFRALDFQADELKMFVYSGAWENRTARTQDRGELSKSLWISAFQSVLWRERNLGQQVVELAISGCHTSDEADEKFRNLLPLLMQRPH